MNEELEGDEGEQLLGTDWARLRELRATFLGAESRDAILEDYWTSRRDFELYDATFARRIGWKWDAVLAELAMRGVTPQGANIVDWGCGTGVATRRYASTIPGVQRVFLVDRSKQAAWFARDTLLAEHGRVETVLRAPESHEPVDVLLCSHVLDELNETGRIELLDLARRATFVVWVEVGSRQTSRLLSQMREMLLDTFDVLAPCTHRAACGVLSRDTENSWCHFFAKPPPDVFTSAFWRKFSIEMSVDLRAVPYSFLALRKRTAVPQENSGARILGRPRLLKGNALLDVCDERGVHEMRMLERSDKALFKRFSRVGEPWIVDIAGDGTRIEEIKPRFTP